MELINGDCLEVMKDLSDNSIDFLFADLPYAQTSCRWDVLIDLELFWKQVNRVCKQDAVMAFTCSVKFGNTLINSNPKCFRYDLVWVKSAACGFLNAKKMPMKKHEMIYIFYRKLAKVYTENIALHHTHKFLKATPMPEKPDLYGRLWDKNGKPYTKTKIQNQYTPPLPNSVIKEENIVVEKRDTTNYKNESDLYGNIERPDFKRKNNESMYNPPLPNSVIKEENVVIKTNLYSSKTTEKPRELYRNEGGQYNPPLPNTILEIKSEKGKHATQKPVPLMEYLIKYFTREGETVLDPTMGSGGTGIACKNLNRNFIGIEKDKDIFDVAVERNK